MSFLAFLSTCLIFGIVDFGPLSWVDFELSLRPAAAKAHLDVNTRILYKYSDLYQLVPTENWCRWKAIHHSLCSSLSTPDWRKYSTHWREEFYIFISSNKTNWSLAKNYETIKCGSYSRWPLDNFSKHWTKYQTRGFTKHFLFSIDFHLKDNFISFRN